MFKSRGFYYTTKNVGNVRSRIRNIVDGVSIGFVKELELNGVGYKATQKGKILELLLGYSHPINFDVPDDLKIDSSQLK